MYNSPLCDTFALRMALSEVWWSVDAFDVLTRGGGIARWVGE